MLEVSNSNDPTNLLFITKQIDDFLRSIIFTGRNEVVAKVMFLLVSVILLMEDAIPACIAAGLRGGVLSQHALQEVSHYALQQVSRGCVPGWGCLVWGVPGLEGGCSWEGGGLLV